ncbi:hypothetical protein SAY86_009387 [Trapa natans]|uniref:Cucumisin n=1 Tax=Trapa natans TaxID=22666 RepID=A0AAN7QQ78_TRANT|nr:hypothetical protein SAY86_009387 [Trapa natans]
MGHLHESEDSVSAAHMSLLQKVMGSDAALGCLLHSYKRSLNGFVAMLTEEEANIISEFDEVVSVFPNGKNKLHTTRSWDFMGFSKQVKRTPLESDVIIGVLDTGIWPESKSFDDQGFGPPPSRWKGACEVSNFTCNNKIIGARYYRDNLTFSDTDFLSPRDSDGHGTHCASTIAGNHVDMASLYGFAYGTARGGVPSARIAVYKVCWFDSCDDAGILAAFDDAIADGVDIISASFGGSAKSYFTDSTAIGSFHAMKAGILTSNSAGNEGPNPFTVSSVSPWLLSVAASTIDREFITKVQIGDGKIYEGLSINTFDLNGSMYPFIYGGDAPNKAGGFNSSESSLCSENSLDPNIVRDKIVLCQGLKTKGPFLAGAAGVVSAADIAKDIASIFPLPESDVSSMDAANIYSYIHSTSYPTATIFKSEEKKDTFAPYVASFSSRGPNPITLDILKPDITAPGVHILAAWSLANPISKVIGDQRFAPYNIISGTSMACPHASAVAAYVKSFHPTWSPAAIKSSLMTTAHLMSQKINTDAEFAYGAGHIDPLRALNPGLIYDADETDYVKFLCGQGYDTRRLQAVTGDQSTCTAANNGTTWDLNYPSFAASTSNSGAVYRTFTRIVTNVGYDSSVYRSTVFAPVGLKIQVTPSMLSFKSIGEKVSYQVTVEGTINNRVESASLVWEDGVHQVRSPIVVFQVGNN